MAPPETFTDAQLLAWIDAVAARYDTCTVGMLAEHSGRPLPTLQYRVSRLIRDGLATRNRRVGSLRTARPNKRKGKRK